MQEGPRHALLGAWHALVTSFMPSPAPDRATAYEILGAPPGADARLLKARYHERAREWHPDVSTHAAAHEMFGRVALAYDILTHPEQRLLYDFVLEHRLPFGVPGRFSRLYNAAPKAVELVRHRNRVAWLAAGAVACAVATLRLRSLRSVEEPTAAEGPPPPSSTASASTAAAGGLFGGGLSFGLLYGRWRTLHPRSGAYMLLASCGGALVGRGLLPWIEEQVGRFRLLRTRSVRFLILNSRQFCEAAGAAAGLGLALRGGSAAALSASRAFGAAALGSLGGHVTSRAACRAGELELRKEDSVS